MGTPATGTSKKRPRCERADWAGKEKGGMEMQLERKVMVKPPKTFRGVSDIIFACLFLMTSLFRMRVSRTPHVAAVALSPSYG